MLVLFVGLGLAGGFLAGLVGIGGAVVMIPLLVYVPPALGFLRLDMHTISGVTMIQVAAAGVSGALGHFRHGVISRRLVLTLGGGMMSGSLAGAITSRFIAATGLEVLFASLALVAGLMILWKPGALPPETPPDQIQFNERLAFGCGAVVGFMVGIVGAGGGFLLVPVMMHILRIPVRAAVGASLTIVALSGIAGAIGKAVTGQVDWPIAAALAAGALAGGRLGAAFSHRLPRETLGKVLGITLMIVAALMTWEILSGGRG